MGLGARILLGVTRVRVRAREWYAPVLIPTDFAPATCASYLGSTNVWPSLALTYANAIPSALTRDQSMRSW